MRTIQTLCALALACNASAALADDAAKPADKAPIAQKAGIKSPFAAAPFAEAKPVGEEKLAKIAGREDVNQITNSDQRNNVTGNDVGDNSVTGQIAISDKAFSNTNGFVILNANTGNNVAINASIQLNVALPVQAGSGQ